MLYPLLLPEALVPIGWYHEVTKTYFRVSSTKRLRHWSSRLNHEWHEGTLNSEGAKSRLVSPEQVPLKDEENKIKSSNSTIIVTLVIDEEKRVYGGAVVAFLSGLGLVPFVL